MVAVLRMGVIRAARIPGMGYVAIGSITLLAIVLGAFFVTSVGDGGSAAAGRSVTDIDLDTDDDAIIPSLIGDDSVITPVIRQLQADSASAPTRSFLTRQPGSDAGTGGRAQDGTRGEHGAGTGGGQGAGGGQGTGSTGGGTSGGGGGGGGTGGEGTGGGGTGGGAGGGGTPGTPIVTPTSPLPVAVPPIQTPAIPVGPVEVEPVTVGPGGITGGIHADDLLDVDLALPLAPAGDDDGGSGGLLGLGVDVGLLG